MPRFRLFWMDGTNDIVSGKSITDIFVSDKAPKSYNSLFAFEVTKSREETPQKPIDLNAALDEASVSIVPKATRRERDNKKTRGEHKVLQNS